MESILRQIDFDADGRMDYMEFVPLAHQMLLTACAEELKGY
jgi:hypothetical protein